MKVPLREAVGLTLGIELVLSIVLVSALGMWADGKLGTHPWLTLLGFVLGVAAGFRSLFRTVAKLDKGARKPRDAPHGHLDSKET